MTAQWCACFQAYQPDRSLCDANRCVYRFPSRHPSLWADQVRDHVGGDWS